MTQQEGASACTSGEIVCMTDAHDWEVQEIGTPEDFKRVELEWNDLLRESDSAIPFLHHDWLRLWWEHFGTGHRMAVLTVRREGRLCLGLPLMEVGARRFGIRITELRSMTNYHSFRFNILVRRGAEDALEAAWRYLRARPRPWHLIQLCEIPWNESRLSVLRELAVRDGYLCGLRGSESPYLRPRGKWEEYTTTLKAKFRSNLRNRRRRLHQLGPVSIVAPTEAADALRLLPTGLDIESRGWKSREGTAIASNPTLTSFYTEWAQVAASQGWLRLFFLSVADTHAAFEYNIAYGGRLYCLKIGYDERFAAYSVGQLLKEEILRLCHEGGFEEYDFLGVVNESKLDWQPELRDHKWLYIYNQDFRSCMAHLYKFGLVPRVKRWIGR